MNLKNLKDNFYLKNTEIESEIVINCLKYFSDYTISSHLYNTINNKPSWQVINLRNGLSYDIDKIPKDLYYEICQVPLEIALSKAKKLDKDLLLNSDYYFHLKKNILRAYEIRKIKE